jgi:putative ABC transport system permease protein
MGIRFLAGRDFEPRDQREEAKSIIVNQALAEGLLGGGYVLERRVQFGDGDDDWYTVVGLVADARAAKLDAAAEPIAYLPYTHLTLPFMRLLARGSGPESATRDALLEALRAEAPDLVQDPPETLTTIVAGATAEPRFRSGMVGAFAAAALGLAVLGLYGLSTYTVSGRTREIATRLALGATPHSMRAGVIREGLTLTGVGLAAGIGIATALGRLIDSLLYETATADPLVIGLLAALMAAASIVACYLPARRAMRVDPVMALRAE